MALYTAVVGTPAGPVCTGVPVTVSDTISGNDVNAGAVLVVTAAATPVTVTLTDPNRTPAGSTAVAGTGVLVAANTSRVFGGLTNYVPTSGANVVTVGYSVVTNITAMVLV